MSIFENSNGFGSLGAGAPDTGRGNAIDRVLVRRGINPTVQATPGPWRQSPGPWHPQHPQMGAMPLVRIRRPLARPIRLVPGEEISVQALQGLAGVGEGIISLRNKTGATIHATIVNAADGNDIFWEGDMPKGEAGVINLPAGRYRVRYTVTKKWVNRGGRAGHRVRAGRTNIIRLW